MICSSCAKQVPSGAWICPYCDFILDPSVLDASTSRKAERAVWSESTGDAPEAMILGDVNIDPEDFQVLPGAGAQGDGRTATFLFYTSGATSRVLRPDVIPVIQAVDRSTLPITPYEDFLLSAIDGKKSVREIQRSSGLQPQEVTITLLTLLDKKIIVIVTPRSDPPAPAPPPDDLPVAKPRGGSKRNRRRKSTPRPPPAATIAMEPLPPIVPAPLGVEDAEAVTEWTMLESAKTSGVPVAPEPEPDPPRPPEPPRLRERPRTIPPPLPTDDSDEAHAAEPPSPPPLPPRSPVLPEVYQGRGPISRVDDSFADETEDTHGMLLGIPRALTPGLQALPTLPPPPPAPPAAEHDPVVIPQEPTPIPELESGEFDEASGSPALREAMPRMPTALLASASRPASDRPVAPPRLPSAFIIERAASPAPPAPEPRSDTPLVDIPSKPPEKRLGRVKVIEERRADGPAPSDPPRAAEERRVEVPKPADERRADERRAAEERRLADERRAAAEPARPAPEERKPPPPRPKVEGKPADGYQMAKAAKLFAEALKDKAEGNIVSARMNMKLAISFDSSNSLYHEAYQELLKAAPIGSANAAVSRARELYDKATTAEKLSRFDEAIELLEQAIEESKDPAFFNRLGVLLAMKKNEFDRAQSLIETALEMSPGNSTYEHNLSKVLQRAAAQSMKGQPKKEKKDGILGFLGRKK